jgi:ATP-dependent helicase/nuclease subunit B
MSESPPRVFTIPLSAPFLPTLAKALVDGRLVPGFKPKDDPLALAGATVFLPTRRATRAFGAALLQALGTEALILPRILPLGDVDEDELAFESEAADLAPAISPTGRRLVLAQLVLQWAKRLFPAAQNERLIAASPAVSLAFADELARVLDDLTIAGVPFERIAEVVPRDLDRYWEISRDFLAIVQREWPKILEEKKLLDPTARREALLAGEAERLRAGADGPVIAAGSTGSLPSVARLLSTIARRKDGAVVLPGLDQMLDEPSFASIGGETENDASQGHPQYGLHRLLGEFGIRREDAIALAEPRFPEREKLLSEAFRPAPATDRWQEAQTGGNDALGGITLVEAADPREEALAIAICLRESLEKNIPRAALITPDRALARRVAAELTRWGVKADDSAGTPLSESEAGRLARLVVEVAATQLAPVPLVALLRHPLAVSINDPQAVDALEQGVLRGPRPAAGLDGLAHAIETARTENFHRYDPKSKLKPEAWDSARDLCARLRAVLEPLCQLGSRAHPFGDILRAHIQALRESGLDLDEAERPDTEKLAEMLDELLSAETGAFHLTLPEYADAFAALLSSEPLRLPHDENASIRILGPLEARLVSFDRVVLGGLNEGTWPAGARTDAFLNRPMRRELLLNLPERRIGLSAHDFAQMMGAPEAIVTRARRQGGAETVASRSWQRIAAVASPAALSEALARGETLLAYARALDRPQEASKPIEKPAPRPPVKVRPNKLSVTEIEDLVRDPYTVYSKHILGLFPLEEIDADPGAAGRGIVLHDALARFTRKFPDALPKDVFGEIVAAGREAFIPFRDLPGAESVWWPRFMRVAEWFAAAEQARRPEVTKIHAEMRGEISFDENSFPFTLSARADRLEILRERSAAVLDYKTGTAPTLREAIVGLSPQLPLEAAIIRAGGFKDVPKGTSIGEIGVFRLSGGNPAGEFISLDPAKPKAAAKDLREKFNIATCNDLADFALARLKALIAHYAKETTPYLPIPRPKWRKRYGAYDHLARIQEWSEGGGEE